MRAPTPKERRLFERAARRYGINPALLWGLEGAESGHSKGAVSSAGAQSWMQIMPFHKGVNPRNRRSAVNFAARYLSTYKDRGIRGMLQAYNAGPAGSDNPESRQHYKNTLAHAKTWRGSLGKVTSGSGGRTVTLEKTTRKAKYHPGGTKVDIERALVDTMLTGSHKPGSLFKEVKHRIATDPTYTTRVDPHTTPAKVKDVKRRVGGDARAPARGTKGQIRKDGWKGAQSAGETLGLGAILKATGNSATTKRPTKFTSSGNVSDHYEGNRDSYAWDISGGDMDKAARQIARALGLRSHKGLQNVTKTIDGRTYRFQLIWQSDGHYDHVHLGVDRVDTPG